MKGEKQLLLDEIKNQLGQASTFIITQYKSIDANKINGFRREIAKIGGSFEVVRKRILVKACEEHGIKLSLDALPGHIGVLIAPKDMTEMTKVVQKFSDDNEKSLQMLTAKFEGHMITADDILRISKLPSRDQMRAEFLGLLEAPMAQTLAVFEALLSSVIYCLDNKSKDESANP